MYHHTLQLRSSYRRLTAACLPACILSPNLIVACMVTNIGQQIVRQRRLLGSEGSATVPLYTATAFPSMARWRMHAVSHAAERALSNYNGPTPSLVVLGHNLATALAAAAVFLRNGEAINQRQQQASLRRRISALSTCMEAWDVLSA